MAEYIKREAALHEIERRKALMVGDKRVSVDAMKSFIKNRPSADVAPVVHGRWISWEQADNFIPSARRHECSACHDAAHVLVNGFELLSDYCPNCGARMDGGFGNG